ncbi:MAG: hypothetical protein L0241_11775 [Planctomycetia bacterium]|nr:hypothetical protein [Planctomycetia bacterium]
MSLALALSTAVMLCTDLGIPKYYVVDFGPISELTDRNLSYDVYINADVLGKKKPLKWWVPIKPNTTALQVRNAAFEALQRTKLPVVKVGDTKLLFYNCRNFSLTTEGPDRKEFPANCRPTVKLFVDEEAARKGK